jgi:hypothetical protein
MARALTDIGIRNLRPGTQRREVADRTPYLYCVIQPSGKRGFALRYRFNGASRKVVLAKGLTFVSRLPATACGC